MLLLSTLPTDILIQILHLVSIPDIISLSKTCTTLNLVCKERIVWINACNSQILQKCYPFPSIAPESISDAQELRRMTLNSHSLASKWKSKDRQPKSAWTFRTQPSTVISDIYFVPGYKGRWLLTVSKGIWSVVTLRDLHSAELQKSAEWSPKGAIFDGITVNSALEAEATVAVGVKMDSEHTVKLLSVDVNGSLTCIKTINSAYKPVALQDDLLAMSDHFSITTIMNWRNGHFATLAHEGDQEGILKSDQCIQVVFAHKSILVIRARSMNLFPDPLLSEVPSIHRPIASHSFGWSDSVSVARTLPSAHSLSIFVRTESENPWAQEFHSLYLYSLYEDMEEESNPPYLFPPELEAQVPSRRGVLRCRDIVLGEHGTALWIAPRRLAVNGLSQMERDPVTFDRDLLETNLTDPERECLMAVVLPGPLLESHHENSDSIPRYQSVAIRSIEKGKWTAFDYDEKSGRIAMGSGDGEITILEM
ncbi:hypothetical protein C8J56DRAFT_912357 [Mycena floridula]|nr:hypothetical protein C8J56DRAFT_912357 [Mycena floridula]